MPIDIDVLCRQIEPEQTVLVFGAGSAVPSGGMTGNQLAATLAEEFNLSYDPSMGLSDIATIATRRRSRSEVIDFLRRKIKPLKPTGSLLNLPYYD